MNLLGTVRRIWGSGDEEDEENNRTYRDEEHDDFDPDYTRGGSSSSYSGYDSESSYDSPDYSAGSTNNSSSKYASSAYPGSASGSASGRSNFSASSASTPGAGLGSSAGNFTGAPSSRMRATNPTLRSREKNIYTIKPKRLDEATVAADCLKTGSAVIVNLEAVDRVTAVRIIDFMSGVCYGIDGAQGQSGHAMKLGEMIFLFTPAEFEITSDETDYAANHDHFFREMTEGQTAPSSAALQGGIPPINPATPPAPQAGNSSFASSYNSPDYTAERRAWER